MPGSINFGSIMFYVYVLEDLNEKLYVGYSADLKRRVEEHNQGQNKATRNRSWRCIYYEACLDHVDARRREKYFKTTSGRRALKTRLQEYFGKRRQPKLH